MVTYTKLQAELTALKEKEIGTTIHDTLEDEYGRYKTFSFTYDDGKYVVRKLETDPTQTLSKNPSPKFYANAEAVLAEMVAEHLINDATDVGKENDLVKRYVTILENTIYHSAEFITTEVKDGYYVINVRYNVHDGKYQFNAHFHYTNGYSQTEYNTTSKVFDCAKQVLDELATYPTIIVSRSINE